MTRRPRLLLLAHTLPFPPDGGVFIRTYHILRLLARDYEVDLIAFDRTGIGSGSRAGDIDSSIQALSRFATVSVVPVPQDTSRIRFLSDHLRGLLTGRVFTHYRYDHPDFTKLVRKSLAMGDYAVIHVDSLDLAGILPLVPLSRVVLTHHNVESELLRDRARSMNSRITRAYVLRQAALQRALERHWCPLVRLNLAVSDRDAERLLKIAPGSSIVTIPNGVDTESIVPSAGPGSGLLCVGGLGWFPNRDALDYLVRDIQPRLATRGYSDLPVIWVGRVPERMADKYDSGGVRLAGYVDDVLPYLDSTACYVMPFRLGGGTRLKLLEAMAAGKAIVTTGVGAMGVDIRHEFNALVADTPEQFACEVIRVLTDDVLRSRLGRNARDTAVSLYGWEAVGQKIKGCYTNLLNRNDTSASTAAAIN